MAKMRGCLLQDSVTKDCDLFVAHRLSLLPSWLKYSDEASCLCKEANMTRN
jgi:hypothetical protein